MSQPSIAQSLRQYECGPFRFSDKTDLDYYDRHLIFDSAIPMEKAGQRERFEAIARSLRDLLMQRWLLTNQTQENTNAK